MPHHHLQLHPEPFVVIAEGHKTIESRLYDDKRKLIELGDTLTFSNRGNPKQTIDAQVIGLLRYSSFEDLFAHNNLSKFGNESADQLLNHVYKYYSHADEKKYGVIGIEFRIVA